MASLNMQGPFPLRDELVDEKVSVEAPGVFALGYLEGIDFVVLYIGRAEEDLSKEIKSWVRRHEKYKVFKFCYAVSAHAAFERQCKNFHEFGGNAQLHNSEHPVPAAGVAWPCPFCT